MMLKNEAEGEEPMGEKFWRNWYAFGLLAVLVGVSLLMSRQRRGNMAPSLFPPLACLVLAVAIWLSAALVAIRHQWLFIAVLKLQLVAWVPLLLTVGWMLYDRIRMKR